MGYKSKIKHIIIFLQYFSDSKRNLSIKENQVNYFKIVISEH